VARKYLEKHRDVDRAVRDVIEQHIRLAGVQGFVTNIGGIVAMPVAIPANLAGLAALHLRMVATIAHLRGYDIADPRIRAAALMTLLGKDGVASGLRGNDLPGTPREVAAGAGELDRLATDRIAARVTQDLIMRIGGKYATLTVAKRVPVLGGAVSAGVDAVSTYSVGRYADAQFPPHVMIERA
jgi:uncharacterized protein (DUF697 family)